MYDILSGTRSVLYSSLSQPTKLSYSPSTELDIFTFSIFNFSFNTTFYFDYFFASIEISLSDFHSIYLLQTIAVLRIKKESFSQISVIETSSIRKLFWVEGSGSRTVYKQGTLSGSTVVEVARYPAVTGQETSIMFHPELMKYVILRDMVLYLYDPRSSEMSQIGTNGEDVRSFGVGPRGSIIFSTYGKQVLFYSLVRYWGSYEYLPLRIKNFNLQISQKAVNPIGVQLFL